MTDRATMGRYRRCFQPRQWFESEGEPDPFPVEYEETLMWVYRHNKINDKFTVGYFTPDGEWFGDGDYATAKDAAARVHYLNGGHVPDDGK